MAGLVGNAQRRGCSRAAREADAMIADEPIPLTQVALRQKRAEPIGEQRSMNEQNRLTGAMLLNLELHGAEVDSVPIGFEGDIAERGRLGGHHGRFLSFSTGT